MPLGSFRFIKTIILSGLLASTFSFANDDNQQRNIFLEAENQVWNASSATYQNLYKQLHYYPLQPYLDQKRLMTKMKLSSATEISEFLTKYEGTPLDWPLRKKWLTYLAKRKQPVLFQTFFKPTSNVELTCQHYSFELQTGVAPTRVLPKVSALWLVGKSQPKVCDPIFKKWQLAGYRTNDLIWQRIVLAADGGKHSLIPYLTKLLPEKEQALAKVWHKVRRDPAYIGKLSRFSNKSAREAEIVAYGLKRLIWRSPEKALDTYALAKTLLPFTKEQEQQITVKFALALASKNHADAASWLVQVDEKLFSSNLTQWYILTRCATKIGNI
jgi:soluble lytic murein transglycosylase